MQPPRTRLLVSHRQLAIATVCAVLALGLVIGGILITHRSQPAGYLYADK